MSLKEIINEIEKIGNIYRETESREVRETYSQYVELITLEAPKSEQYNLCNYWEKLKR